MNENREVAIQITGVRKMYKLGQINRGTLEEDLQSWWARVRGKEDPNSKIGQENRLVGQTFMALNGIDLTIYKGEALGIIGANGAGKSTLLKLLSRVTAPTEGEIDLYGRVSSMLEVQTGFSGEMTGRENIYVRGAILGMTKAEIDSKMEQIIDFSELRDFIDTPFKRYSSGMKVKLGFSVSAHLDSEIIIMDEVLAVGDMAFQKKCIDKMREAANKEGRTVLYVSHNMNTIRQLCDRCIVLDQGKIVFDGDVEEAIGIYSHANTMEKTDFVFTENHHTNRKSTGKFVIESLKIKNGGSNICDYGESISVDISCANKEAFEDVFFRFEIKYQDLSMAGTMFTDRGITFPSAANRQLSMVIDTSHLTPGWYTVDIVAFQFNAFGQEKFLDGVYPAMQLEISDKLTEEHRVNWLHKYWGHIKLHDVTVEEYE